MTWRRAVAPDSAVERERQLWLAFQSGDRTRIESLIAADAIDIGPGGILTRDEVIDAVAQMHILTFDLDDVRVQQLGPDVEIVVSRSVVAGTYRDKPFSHDVVRSTSVWTRDDGPWRLVHRVECPEAKRERH